MIMASKQEHRMKETHYEALQRSGVSRRDFLKFCSMTAAWLGLAPTMAPVLAHALETRPRLPVIWIEGLSCTCCTESFIRSSHPLASDVILNMINLDYNDTLMAAAGVQAQEAFEEAISKNRGNYILAVEGNAPLGNQGMYCIDGGQPWLDRLRKGAAGAKAVVAWGTCACWGCIQAARPNPTTATPVPELIVDKPVVKIPGCPPIPDVMSALIAYVVTFDRLPELDSQGRFAAFYGQHVHDQCVRRAHFDAGEFVEEWGDEASERGYCLYKMGCRGPTTYNACPNTRWNDGTSYPIEAGHPCLGCSEQGYFDQGSFYERVNGIPVLDAMSTPAAIATGVAGTIAAGIAIHAGCSIAFNLHEKKKRREALDAVIDRENAEKASEEQNKA